jgi:hypothetical protein
MHELLVVAPKWLMVSYVLDSCLPSSRVDEVNVTSSELVLHGFVICLETGGEPMVISGGRTALASYTNKKGVSPMAQLGDVQLAQSSHGTSSIHLAPCFSKQS